MNIGQNIKFYRDKLSMSQAKLSELTDMEPANINRIENGKVVPIIETLLKICNALEVTPNDLLAFEYKASKTQLDGHIATLLDGCTQEESAKIAEYVLFVKGQRK